MRVTGERPARAGGQKGTTLLDLAIGIMLVVVTVGAVTSSLTAGHSMNRVNRERSKALGIAEGVLERLRSEDFEEIFARYNATTADDPVAGASPGAGFAVEGLAPLENDPDGLVGRIEFPGDGLVLREDFVDRELGTPRDLNGDGAQDALDHAGDYLVLPVRVSAVWTGSGGMKRVDLVTTLTRP
jgi:hypothetical protein